MKITLILKRADGKIKEQFSECKKLEDYCSGADMMLRNGFIKAYLIKDSNTNQVLMQKGEF